jgi:hypothetical protein
MELTYDATDRKMKKDIAAFVAANVERFEYIRLDADNNVLAWRR